VTKIPTLTSDDYLEHRDSFDGYCSTCTEFTTFGGVEPDAVNYTCESCGEPTLMGAEEALMEGLLTIVRRKTCERSGDNRDHGRGGDFPD
jgi:hypothetical protein